MCVNSRLRVNAGALALWSRLNITLDGVPFVGSPSDFFTALNWNYYDDKSSNALRSSSEWIPFLNRISATLNSREYPIFCEIKCHKCKECISEKVSELQSRAVLEASQAQSMFFVTLTYDDANLPLNSAGVATLNPQHITEFLKHTRNTFSRLPENHPLHDIKFRVVCCGEYGSRTHRPHYHLLVFADKFVHPRWYRDFEYHFTKRWTSQLVFKKHKSPDIYACSTNTTFDSLNHALTNGKKTHYNFPRLAYSNLDNRDLTGYTASPNPLYHGYICDFDWCRNVEASAKYIMKYIAKWKLDETDYYNPLDPDSDEKLPYKPFLRTPKHIALGNTALNDDTIVNGVLQSSDNTIYVRLTNLNGFRGSTSISRITIPQSFKNAICRPFSRYFPSVGLACSIIRDAVNVLNRHKQYYDYSQMTKTINDLPEVKPFIEQTIRGLKKRAIDPLFAKWIYNNLSQIEFAFNNPIIYPYSLSENVRRDYAKELRQLHSILFATPSACLYVLGRLLPIYGELPSYDEYCEFNVDRFMMFAPSTNTTPLMRHVSGAKKRYKTHTLFNSKFNHDE